MGTLRKDYDLTYEVTTSGESRQHQMSPKPDNGIVSNISEPSKNQKASVY